MVIPGGCSTHTACYKSPVKKQGTQERCLAHGQRDVRPDFHGSQYHILPGCLVCSDAEFPLETVSSREAFQLCRSANHSCFSIQMLGTASSKLLPGAELPVGDCTDISSCALLPVLPDLTAARCRPMLLGATPPGWLLLRVKTGKIQSDSSELWLKENWIIKKPCVFQTHE